jgi:hypothetical protein
MLTANADACGIFTPKDLRSTHIVLNSMRKNNTKPVLLIEWKAKGLLFVSDAEWGQTKTASKSEPLAILNAILPLKSKGKAQAVVSTERAKCETIPRSDFLVEIGRRFENSKTYAMEFKQAGVATSNFAKFALFEKASFDKPQPLRTHLELMLGSEGFIDVEIAL